MCLKVSYVVLCTACVRVCVSVCVHWGLVEVCLKPPLETHTSHPGNLCPDLNQAFTQLQTGTGQACDIARKNILLVFNSNIWIL